jgi:hypothetical protein
MDPITIALSLGTQLIQRLFPDPAAQADAKLKLLELQQNGVLAELTAQTQVNQAQAATNTEEAKSTNMFIAGWRPFVGWVCGVGFGIQALGPLLTWGSMLLGHKVEFPPMDFSVMGPTLAGMLGIGTMRTIEKIQGAEANR